MRNEAICELVHETNDLVKQELLSFVHGDLLSQHVARLARKWHGKQTIASLEKDTLELEPWFCSL